MITALNAPDSALDPHERSFVANIREHGWFHHAVFGDDEGPGFSYTSGLTVTTGHPEVIMFSIDRKIAHDVFWDLFRDAQVGRSVKHGVRNDRLFANRPAYAFSVAKRYYPEFLGWNRWLYGGDGFPCLQIVWPDRAGLFPWQQGFDPTFADDQPDLTENGWLAEAAN